ncbi:MAG: efflux RND transporter permease subunit [Pseudomonadales bacterium]
MKRLLENLVRLSLAGGVPVLTILAALLAGAFALLVTPREEEPQIVVPSADVLIEAPSLSARQVERLIATPMEKLLAQIDGVEHVYSVSETGRAVVTVAFYVGEDREDSLLKLYSKVYSHQDEVPAAVTGWVVRPIEVDDVAIVTATLWSEDPAVDDYQLRRLADEVAIDLQTVPRTNRIEVIGGERREFEVLLQPMSMAGRSTSIDDVLNALTRSNMRRLGGGVDRDDTRLLVELDGRIASAHALAALTVNVVDGVAVHLGEIAAVRDGPAEPDNYTWIQFAANHPQHSPRSFPAVNVAIAKERGANAVRVADDLLGRLKSLQASIFPAGVHVEITRNYGETANAKIGDLVSSLGVAVVVVVALIGLTLGWRAALVVALAVPVCYGITLALDYAAGYTINRVTLFALILALGLLVDDPITGVDNIERHLRDPGDSGEAVVRAISEIRWPLLMSTLAIVIVFAPMSFITGMMGPYMSPMAFNVPVAVITSTVVAFVVTPWLAHRLLGQRPAAIGPGAAGELTNGTAPGGDHELARAVRRPHHGLYAALVRPLLASRKLSLGFLALLLVLLVLAMLLPLLRVVPLKLLPYDNKNEFQVVLDADEGTTLESLDGVARALTRFLVEVPEVRAVNAYIGTHAPMDFNGMIRRYYLRSQPHQGELHVVLADKQRRPEQSHALILRLRPDIDRIGREYGVNVKLVEVPPGPPVIATVVAEHYGEPTTPYQELLEAAHRTAARLSREPGVVDVDVSAQAESQRWVYVPDQEKAALSGISADVMASALAVLTSGTVAGQAAVPDEVQPLPIRVRVPYPERTALENLFVKGQPGVSKIRERGAVIDAPTPLVSLAELGAVQTLAREQLIYHKDLRPVAYTYAEVAGRVPAAIVYDVDADRVAEGAVPEQAQPRPLAGRTYFNSGGGLPWALPEGIRLTWSGEGEWDITLRVFRDLGIAFAVALLGLYIVIRLQTGMAALTAIIMLAIPLTAVGIMPGFWLLNAFSGSVGSYADPELFTATAMIGMIALAGIVVRNSLILIEFIQQARAEGASLDDALLEAGHMRTRPVLLTAGTTLLGNVVITLDPIFAGLAWAIIFGVTASTLFTLLVVPVVYKLVYGGADD